MSLLIDLEYAIETLDRASIGTNVASALETLNHLENTLSVLNDFPDDVLKRIGRLSQTLLISLQSRPLLENEDFCCSSSRIIKLLTKKKLYTLSQDHNFCRVIVKMFNIHKYSSEVLMELCDCLELLLRECPNLIKGFSDQGLLEVLKFSLECHTRWSDLAIILCNCASRLIKGNSDMQSHLSESLFITSIISLCSKFPSNYPLISATFALIGAICENHSLNTDMFMEAGLLPLVRFYLNGDDESASSSTFELLRCITKFKRWVPTFDGVDCQIIPELIFSLGKFPVSANLVACCEIIRNMASIKSVLMKLGETETADYIGGALQHNSLDVRMAACRTIITISVDADMSEALVNAGVCLSLSDNLETQCAEMMRTTEEIISAVRMNCCAVAALAQHAAADLGACHCCKHVLATILDFQEFPSVLAAAYHAVRELTITCQENVAKFSELNRDLVLQSLLQYPNDSDLWEHGLGLLAQMIVKSSPESKEPNAAPTTGQENSTTDMNLAQVIMRALQSFAEHREITINSCWCIVLLYHPTRGMVHLLVRAGLCEVLVETLRIHSKCARVAEKCAEVISTITNPSEVGKGIRQSLIFAGAIEVMTQCLGNCSRDREMVRKVCMAIQLLVTIGGDAHLLCDRLSYAGTQSAINETLQWGAGLEARTLLLTLDGILTQDENRLPPPPISGRRHTSKSVPEKHDKITSTGSDWSGTEQRVFLSSSPRNRAKIVQPIAAAPVGSLASHFSAF